MKTLYKILSIILFISLLSACAEVNFKPASIQTNMSHPINADLRLVDVVIANDEEKTGDIQFYGDYNKTKFIMNFKSALESTLINSNIFSESSNIKVILTAKLMEISSPLMSATFPTNVVVKYTLTEKGGNNNIYSKDISSSASVPFNYSFLGNDRWIEARNRAVISNITSFIQELTSSQIN